MKPIRPYGLRIVRGTISRLALLAVALSVAGGSESADAGGRDGIEGKMEYCKDCHGQSGQGYRGYFPIPRLAGQQTEYLKNQLQAFVEHRRTNNIMFNVAHSLSPATIAALAADFRALNPEPLGGGSRNLVGTGEKNLSRRSTRRQYRGMRRMSRSGGPGQRGNSPLGGPTP